MRRYPIKTYLKWLVIGLVSVLVGRWCRIVPNQPLWSMDATNLQVLGIDEAHDELLAWTEDSQAGKQYLIAYALRNGHERRRVELSTRIPTAPTPFPLARLRLPLTQVPVITSTEVVLLMGRNHLLQIDRQSGVVTQAKTDPSETIVVSPTGKYLLSKTDHWIIRTRAEQRIVLEVILPGSFDEFSPTWSPDEENVIFGGRVERSGGSIPAVHKVTLPDASQRTIVFDQLASKWFVHGFHSSHWFSFHQLLVYMRTTDSAKNEAYMLDLEHPESLTLTPSLEPDRDNMGFDTDRPFADDSVVRVRFVPISRERRMLADVLHAIKLLFPVERWFEPKLEVKRFASSRDPLPVFSQIIPLGTTFMGTSTFAMVLENERKFEVYSFEHPINPWLLQAVFTLIPFGLLASLNLLLKRRANSASRSTPSSG